MPATSMNLSSMNNEEAFQKCWEEARNIVESYRAEAPEGLDPQNTWVAIGVTVAGAAVSAGGAAYQANKSKKAAQQAGSVRYNTTPVQLGDPAQVDPYQVLQQTYFANGLNLQQGRQQAQAVNNFNYGQANKFYNKIQPYFNELQGQIGQNALSYARGELPGDVQDQITRAAAQRGIQSGYGFGSQGFKAGAGANLNLRNLGLTSLDLSKYGTQLGMQVNQNAKALLPNLTGLQDFWLNPQQVLGINQQNVAAQNQFALQNNQLANQGVAAQNAALANQTQSQYAQQLAQAQMVGGTAQALGGAISGLGTGGGFSTGGALNQPSQGLGYSQFATQINPQQIRAGLA